MNLRLVLTFLLLFCSGAAVAAPSAIVVDADNGKVILDNNAKQLQYPASLTKVMTLYITFHAIEEGLLDWEDEIYVSSYASRQPKSKMYLKKGDTITVEEAVKAIIVRSANDAAVVIAETIGGTEENFANIMNDFAKKLGMKDTTFSNASGLTDEGVKSSALDIAKLSLCVMHHFPDYYPLFSTKSFNFRGKTYGTTNNLLKTYKGAEGLKTGYTNKAGYNLAFSAANDDARIIAVAMGRTSVKDRDRTMKKLLDTAFKKIKSDKENENKQTITVNIPKAEMDNYRKVKHYIRTSKAMAAASEQDRRKMFLLNDEGGEWVMQVGAYFDEKQALQAAKNILAKLFDGLDTGVAKVEEAYNSKGRKVYKAQIANLSKYNAYEACVNYKKCLIVRPSISKNDKLALRD